MFDDVALFIIKHVIWVAQGRKQQLCASLFSKWLLVSLNIILEWHWIKSCRACIDGASCTVQPFEGRKHGDKTGDGLDGGGGRRLNRSRNHSGAVTMRI